MNYDPVLNMVFCHGPCNNWKSAELGIGVYKDGEIVKCCDCETQLGYKWDVPQLYMQDEPQEKEEQDEKVF